MESQQQRSESGRRILHRTQGNQHGPVTRLMSPSDLGQVAKPFVFLDLVDTGTNQFQGFGLHPHSGIATVTFFFEGAVTFEDTNGASGKLRAGSLEWMRAGKGAWHGGGFGDEGRSRGFQLWVALPGQMQKAIGDDVLATLSSQTGLSREELLTRLSRELPTAVDRYTPQGRVPNDDDDAL